MHRTAIKTVFALMLSTGLVACVTDDSTDTDTQDRAYDPDPFPQNDKANNVQPGDEKENPADAPGRIPAPLQGTSPNVHIQNNSTTDVDIHRGTQMGSQEVTMERSTADLNLNHGSSDPAHVTGENIGYTCDGQDVNCRTSDPQRLVR
jgi:hypothetical protein